MKTIKCLFSLSMVAATCFLFSCGVPQPEGPTPTSYVIIGAQDVEPAFSPDGNWIAYSHLYDTVKSYPQGLYLIDHNGENRKLVLKGFHFSPSWSPDGQWLVFTSGGKILKCKIDGSSLTSMSLLNDLSFPEYYYPDWFPLSNTILFDKPLGTDWGFYSASTDFTIGGRFLGETIFGRNPESAPNEAFVVYEAGKGANVGVVVSEIFLFEVATKKIAQLTKNGKDNRAPTWSPDGKRISWTSSVRLSVMNADGSGQKEISFGNDPSWSINNEIVYSHANANYTKEVLYVLSPDGVNKKQITF